MNDLLEAFEEVEGIALPTKWVVCPSCRGRGTMTLKRIAISAEEFYEDPDFADDYLNGVYDEPCDNCHGRTTVQEVDEANVTPDLLAKWHEWLREDAECSHIAHMERMMGA